MSLLINNELNHFKVKISCKCPDFYVIGRIRIWIHNTSGNPESPIVG